MKKQKILVKVLLIKRQLHKTIIKNVVFITKKHTVYGNSSSAERGGSRRLKQGGGGSRCSLSHVWLWPHELPCAGLPWPSLSPGICSNSCLLSPWCHLTISSSVALLPSIFPSISVFQWVSSSHQLAKILELQLQHQSFQWIFRVDFL